jgi:hypothetical protein
MRQSCCKIAEYISSKFFPDQAGRFPGQRRRLYAFVFKLVKIAIGEWFFGSINNF